MLTWASVADPRTIVGVLSEIANIASETLDLQEVFDRVGAAVRRVIPFEHMGVVRIVGGDRVVLHATTNVLKARGECFEAPLSAWSPRWRPYRGRYPRVEEAKAELDPAFPMDAEALIGGLGSCLWEPFRQRSSFSGGIWLCSYETRAFTDEHQELLRPIAALIGSAVGHWGIWEAESRRRERLDRLDEALEQLTATLDVQQMVQKVHETVQSLIPHDLIAVTELDETLRRVRVAAWAGESDSEIPTESVPLTEEESERRLLPFEFLHDIPAELPASTERNREILKSGMRSLLRVPIRLWGQVRGSLCFLHREPSRFQPEDAELARRIADRIALVLSHRRLAEEERIAEEQKERAERLAATVETLARELDSRRPGRVVGVSAAWKETLLQVGRVAGTETTILLTGESGTGKEVVAGLIHQGSPRAGNPFVALNCAALPEQLLESELFGHEKGAFTGAVATKIGRIEQAAGGTLFLDGRAVLVSAQTLPGLERDLVETALKESRNNKARAARRLGITRSQLYSRLQKYHITV